MEFLQKWNKVLHVLLLYLCFRQVFEQVASFMAM